MTSMPIVFRPGLTRTLRDLRMQKSMVESVTPQLSPAFPSMRQSCAVCDKLAPDTAFAMRRGASDGAASGWTITHWDAERGDGAARLRAVSLYEAVTRLCPRALGFVAFPPQTAIIADGPPMFFVRRQAAPDPGRFIA